MKKWFIFLKTVVVGNFTLGCGSCVDRNPNLSGCEIRICPENPDVKSGEIRAITSGISEFLRMRNPEKSGFACLLNKVLEHFRLSKSGFLWICNAKKSGQVPPERPNLSGCEIRICPDAIYKKNKNKSILIQKPYARTYDFQKKQLFFVSELKFDTLPRSSNWPVLRRARP